MPDTQPAIPRYLEYVLGLTAIAAGAVDVISFVKLGGTLASAMTGNLAFLGLYLARGSLRAAIGSAIALLAFILGGSFGTLLTGGKNREDALKLLLTVEAALLVIFALLWYTLPRGNDGIAVDLMVALLALAMGLQSIVGKKVNLSNIPTIVFTSTLTNIVISVTENFAAGRWKLPTDARRQIASFWLYFLGAFLAAVLIYFVPPIAPLLPLAMILAALATRLTHT